MKIALPIRLLCFICLFASTLLSVTSSGQVNGNSFAYNLQHTDNDNQKLKVYEKILKTYHYTKPDSAVFYLKQGLSQFTASNYQPGIASMLAYLSVIYSDQNKSDIALEPVEKALKIYTELKDKNGIASAHNIIGVILSRSGHYTNAAEHFFISLKIFEAQHDTDGITNTCIKIGGNYDHSGDYGKALEYYNKGFEMIKDLSANDLVILRNSNIRSIFGDKKDNFISMKYLQKMLYESKDTSYVEIYSLPPENMGVVYARNGDTVKALDYMRHALNLAVKDHLSSLYECFSLDCRQNTNLQNKHSLIEPIDIKGIAKSRNRKQKTDLQNPGRLRTTSINISGEPNMNNIPVTGIQTDLQNPGKTWTGPINISGESNMNKIPETGIQTDLQHPGNTWIGSNNISGESNMNKIPETGIQKTIETSNGSMSLASEPNLVSIQTSDFRNTVELLNTPFYFNIADELNGTQKTNLQYPYNIIYGTVNLPDVNTQKKNQITEPQNNNEILTESLKIAGESTMKKIQAGNLESLIELSKKKGDYKQAFSLLEQQKKLLDSIVYLDSKLANANVETLSDINKLNSKVQELTLSEQEQHQKKDFTALIAGLLCISLVVVASFWNRTKIINKELSSREVKLRNAGTVKNKLISVIAHDLTGAIGFMPLSLGLCRDKSIPEEDKDILLNQLEANANASYATLQNMLDWGKVQIQGISVSPSHLNVNTIFTEVMAFIAIAASNKQITIKNKIDNDVQVFADPNHLKFIFRNLLSNAVKYSKNNGTIVVDARLSDDLVYVLFSVADEGTGISERQKKSIFSQYTESIPGTDNEKGNGIGLNLCKEFVNENGGKIWFESEENKGSVFYFSLKNSA